MRIIDWIGVLFASAIMSSSVGVIYVLRDREERTRQRWSKGEEQRRPTMPRMPLTSREAWLEACGTDPRSCVVCDLIIRPGSRMWTRIHGNVMSYLHENCADENGEACPRR